MGAAWERYGMCELAFSVAHQVKWCTAQWVCVKADNGEQNFRLVDNFENF
jgi:hypothetical protein